MMSMFDEVKESELQQINGGIWQYFVPVVVEWALDKLTGGSSSNSTTNNSSSTTNNSNTYTNNNSGAQCKFCVQNVTINN